MPPGASVPRTNLEIRLPPLASREAYPQSPARTGRGSRRARGDSQPEAYHGCARGMIANIPRRRGMLLPVLLVYILTKSKQGHGGFARRLTRQPARRRVASSLGFMPKTQLCWRLRRIFTNEAHFSWGMPVKSTRRNPYFSKVSRTWNSKSPALGNRVSPRSQRPRSFCMAEWDPRKKPFVNPFASVFRVP